MDPAGSCLNARVGWPAWLCLGAIVCLGTWLRLSSLDEDALFIDEAESSLNALAILEHGYPADHYLGLPMFENTLTEPWPASSEYEFRDTSYSPRGMAIYHGWLPLYAIALSLQLHGIRPDVATDPPRVQHDDAEIRRRIRAARLPAVAFGALFVVAVFLAGRSLYGLDAGLAASLAAALLPGCLWIARQARYYSAALALSTLAVYLAWQVRRHGRWRDFAAAGIAFVLLFHTHSIAFVIALVPSALLLPGVLRQARAPAKLALWGGIVLLGLGPWMLWTGYLEHAARIPMARAYLDFPRDYFLYLRARPALLAAAALGLACGAGLLLVRRRLPGRLLEAARAGREGALFLVVWVLATYSGFHALVPAASCSLARLEHGLIGGPILLGAIALATLARALLPRHATPAAVAASLGLVLAWGGEPRRTNPYETRAVFELVEHLRTLEFGRDTRIYALPYQHFCLSYYTGLPVQTIAPVRREFLERYPGEVLILETVNRLPPPRRESVQGMATAAGAALDPDQAAAWVPVLHAAMIRAELAPLVREVRPEPALLPAWAAPAVAALRAESEQHGHGRFDFALDNPAMFQDLPPMTLDEFWPAFFYRFVGPERRTGARLNYAGRMRAASAEILPCSWIVLRCPRREVDPR